MGCLDGITANVVNDCTKQPTAGLEQVAYAINRGDISAYTQDVSNPNLITDITLEAGKVAHKITSFRNDIDSGYDLVASETLPDKYAHYFKMMPWDENSAQVNNLDNLEDLVIVVERKGRKTHDGGDGAFKILGLDNGLYKSSASKRANDNNGIPTYEFTSRAGEEENQSERVFYVTDYVTTKAALEALLV